MKFLAVTSLIFASTLFLGQTWATPFPFPTPNDLTRRQTCSTQASSDDHALWVDRFKRYQTKHSANLNATKNAALHEATALAESFTESKVPGVKKQILDEFGFEEGRRLVTTLDDGHDDGAPNTAVNLGCDCSTIDDWCGGYQHCQLNSFQCERLDASGYPLKCGFARNYCCDGMCQMN